jgi:hypothetical protein
MIMHLLLSKHLIFCECNMLEFLAQVQAQFIHHPCIYFIQVHACTFYYPSPSRDATDEQLIANLKKFLVEQAETSGSSGEGGCVAGGRSPFGGKTSFSPKKPKQADSRPAVLARNGWVITIDRRRGIVTVGGDSFSYCAQHSFQIQKKKMFDRQIFIFNFFSSLTNNELRVVCCF